MIKETRDSSDVAEQACVIILYDFYMIKYSAYPLKVNKVCSSILTVRAHGLKVRVVLTLIVKSRCLRVEKRKCAFFKFQSTPWPTLDSLLASVTSDHRIRILAVFTATVNVML